MKTELQKAQDHLTVAAKLLDNDHPAVDDVLGAMMHLARLHEQVVEVFGAAKCPKRCRS